MLIVAAILSALWHEGNEITLLDFIIQFLREMVGVPKRPVHLNRCVALSHKHSHVLEHGARLTACNDLASD